MSSGEENAIIIRIDDERVAQAASAIIVPEKALTDAGHIRMVTLNSSAHAKHEFHAMAQIAFSRFEDGDLEVENVSGPVILQWKNEAATVDGGAVLFIDTQGHLHLLAHEGQNVNKLLQTAHRFCTRWIRLDI